MRERVETNEFKLCWDETNRMAEAIIIGVLIVNILTVITGYFLSSRCTKIRTPCCEIERDVPDVQGK
jgi:hypothetical protein